MPRSDFYNDAAPTALGQAQQPHGGDIFVEPHCPTIPSPGWGGINWETITIPIRQATDAARYGADVSCVPILQRCRSSGAGAGAAARGGDIFVEPHCPTIPSPGWGGINWETITIAIRQATDAARYGADVSCVPILQRCRSSGAGAGAAAPWGRYICRRSPTQYPQAPSGRYGCRAAYPAPSLRKTI